MHEESRGRSQSPRSRHSLLRHSPVHSSSIDNSRCRSPPRAHRHKRQRLQSRSKSQECNIESDFYRRLLGVFEKETLLDDKFRKDDELNQDNWIVWQTSILRTLAIYRLDGFPLGDYHAPEKAEREHQAWLTLDRAVSDYILKNISSNQLQRNPALLRIYGGGNHETTSAEVWQHLRAVYGTYDVANLLRALLFTIVEEDADMGSHLGKMNEIRMKLAYANLRFEDHDFNEMVLGTLPDSWRDFASTHRGMMAGIAVRDGNRSGFSTILLTNAIQAECDWRKATNKNCNLKRKRFNNRRRPRQ